MTVRFGVIGLRRGQSFIRMCQAAGGGKVTALFDVDETRVQATATEIGVRAYSNFEDFLNADIDAVVVASPVPYHAEQAIAALKAGKHVLSEVTACDSMEEAGALARAARETTAVYMMAENDCYPDEIELVKRLHDDGRFGDAYYLEGEYLHDCKDLWFDDAGELTWRGRGAYGVYITHSLGPIFYITGDRVVSVSAMVVPGGKFHPEVTKPTMSLLTMRTVQGRTLRVRVDNASPRPHAMMYCAIQGTRGSYESQRGMGDAAKLWLEDSHEPSRVGSDGARWHALLDLAEQYIPERLAAPAQASLGGHGTSEYWLLKDFLAAVRGETASPIDIFRALDYTIPGLLAVESARGDGMPARVPDLRHEGA